MSLASKYDPVQIEDKWYKIWQEKGFFNSKPNPNKEPFTIVIPPPNVTGVLHMGHMLNNTIQDILTRRARMKGKETCWVPGTDHASIATEAKVVAMLKEKGIDKESLSREEFLKYAWEWKDKYGGIILEQLKKLGASCDWKRTKFTMDEDLSKSVISVFIDLYEKGHIYRGIRMVNWDPEGKTALADDEVIYREIDSQLYYIKYKIKETNDSLTIATTRPETLLGDTAVCINPNDNRFKKYKGKKAIVPLVNREVPIIEDEYVDMEFGTGCLKVTPSHDENDYKLGQKHNLESIDIFDDEGKINGNGILYTGKDRFKVRKQIIKDLDKIGQLEKIENYKNKVGFSERTDAVVEPKLSTQWFLRMKEIKKPALKNVLNDNIQFHPKKLKNMYKSWMENINDWCISRQLWWGHQIPAYYLPNGEFVVAENIEEALKKAKKIDNSIKINDLKQDEDILDTWFSSWLWPISVFDGINNPDNEEIKYYYPTSDLVTAPEIIFFWVARMIISGYEYRKEMPFKNVYFTGIVRDEKRRKMSKSLGNSPDPIELMKKYGADGVRSGMLFSAPAGNDLLFNEKLCEQGRNFSNKLWNAFRLIKGFKIGNKEDNNSRYVISLSHGWTYKRDVELIIDNYKGVIIDSYNDDNVIALFESSKTKNLKESLEALISFLLVENNKIAPSENKKFIDVASHFKNIRAFSWDSSRPDSHAPIGILGDHTHSKKDVMLSYRFNSEIKSNNLNGNTLMSQEHVIETLGYDKYVSSSVFNTHSIEFMYGITDDVTLMSLFNYHSNTMEVIKKNPLEYNSSGMGDMEFQFLMNFFKKRFLKIHSNVGFKLPFGSIDKEFNDKLLPYSMQLGSGSLSILLGFTGLFQSKKISAGFQPLLNVSTNTNSRGYSYGNLFNINYWLSYKLSKIISLSYRQQNIINSKINGMDEDLDPWDISLNNTNNSSYEIIQSFFGLNTSILKGVFKNFRFSVEYAVPLHQNYDGIQMGLDGKFIAGIQFSPGGHKHH